MLWPAKYRRTREPYKAIIAERRARWLAPRVLHFGIGTQAPVNPGLPRIGGGFALEGGWVTGWIMIDRKVRRALYRARRRVAWDVYEELCDRMELSGEAAGSYTGSIREIAGAVNSNPGTVTRALKQLQADGFVTVTKNTSTDRCRGNTKATLQATTKQRFRQRITPLMSDGSTVYGSAQATTRQRFRQQQGNTLEEEEGLKEEELKNERQSRASPVEPASAASVPPSEKKSSGPKRNYGNERVRILAALGETTTAQVLAKTEELISVLNGQRASGIAADSAVVRQILDPLDKVLQNGGLSSPAWEYGLDAALRKEAPNGTYVVKAARGWKADGRSRAQESQRPATREAERTASRERWASFGTKQRSGNG